MEVCTKVTSSNVLAFRNVNVPLNSVVTKSPLTFPNKLERPQKSKINTFFPVSSKGKLDSISPAGNCASAGQTPSSAPAAKMTTARIKSGNQLMSGARGSSASQDTSLSFPLDDWDDLDDFEPSAKTKNDSFSSEVSGKNTNPASSTSEEKAQLTGKLNHDASLKEPELSNNTFANKSSLSRSEQSHVEMDKECSVAEAAVLPELSLNQDQAECKVEESPVKVRRRRPPPANLQFVMSDSEEDTDVELKPFTGSTGNKLFAAFVSCLYTAGEKCALE